MRNLASSPFEAILDREDRVIADLLCVRCGKNLRGQVATAACADCGHPISDSVHGDYLIYSDPLMVRTLAVASRLVLYSALLLIGLTGLGLFATVLGSRDVRVIIANSFDVIRFGASIAPLIAAIGLVMLTPRRTLAYYQARLLKPRNVAWTVAGAIALIAAVSVGAYFAGRIVAIVAVALWIVVPISAFLRAVQRLMQRVPDNRVARLAGTEFVLFIVGGVAALAVLLIREFAAERGWEDALVGLTFVFCLLSLLLAWRGYLLLLRVRDALDRAAR